MLSHLQAYHWAVIIGLLFHFLIKYVVSPGWNLQAFINGEWRYVVTSIALCFLLALFGPGMVEFVLSMFPVQENVASAVRSAPSLVGFLLGATGGSMAYNLPLVGSILKDTLQRKQ